MEETPPILIPTKLMDLMDLRHQASELKFLCDHYDPFTPPTPTDIQQLLHKYALGEDSGDPFQTTNKLILLLENTLEELQQRQEKELE